MNRNKFKVQKIPSRDSYVVESKHDDIIEEHQFTESEQWMVFLFTFISACSLIAVIVALAKTHSDRG